MERREQQTAKCWRAVSCHPRRRSGLTLLEVLVSTSIFVASLVGIMQILAMGHRSRMDSVLETEAALRCETVFAELLSGVHPLAGTSEQNFEDDADWIWSATVVEQGHTSLLQVEVTVQYQPVDRAQPGALISLKRFVRDPALFSETAGGSE